MDDERKITEEEWQETNQKIRELFHDIATEALQKWPLWMRLNYFASQISNAIHKGYTQEDFNWEYINEMCVKNLDVFDYNMYEPVSTIEQFESQRFDVIAASEGIGPWHKHKCKDCDKEFYMTYKEVHFYADKELHLPKRCKDCRNKRKKGN